MIRSSGLRGMVISHALSLFIVVSAVLSLCLDYGIRVAAESELQTIADAAALAGAERLLATGDPLTRHVRVTAAALACGNANARSMNAGSVLRSPDVELGKWDDDRRVFEASGADAVRVTATRCQERGNAIPTLLVRLLGFDGSRATRSAIARVDGPPDYALIGLERFVSRGVLTVDASPWTGRGSIASNGDVTLNLLGLVGVSLVDGHVATLGHVHKPLIGLLTHIRDGVRRPDEPFVLPPVSVDAARLKNDNGRISHLIDAAGRLNVLLTADVPAGTYYLEELNVLAGALIRIQGPVTLFVNGDVSVLGTVLVLGDDAGNLKVRVAGPGQITVAANVALTADVYAPKSDVTIAAGVIYRGRLIARRIEILGTSFFFLKPELPLPELGRPRAVLVK